MPETANAETNDSELRTDELEEQKFNRWKKLLLVPLILAAVGFGFDRWLQHEEHKNALRVEMAEYLTNAETYAGVHERAALFNYLLQSDLIHYDHSEFVELHDELVASRKDLSTQIIPGIVNQPTKILYSTPDSIDCDDLNPITFLDATSAILVYQTLESPWAEAVTKLQDQYEEDEVMVAITGFYAALCPERFN